MTPDAAGRPVAPPTPRRRADAALDVTRLTPSPPVAAAEAAQAVRGCFGLAGELSRLPGEADDNFLLQAADGRRYVVKVAHQRADPAVVGVQVRVLRHIESAAPGLPVPRVVPAAGGQPWAVVAGGPPRASRRRPVRDTATMVNGFDMESVDTLDPELRQLVERRASLLGPAYKLFYAKPVRFVRAEGVYLFDADGQAYLDAYNNVPSVGHCHPRVVAAIARQAATLNTHTRYASELILDYAERLLATYPAGLGHVMFTCTGSEAVDLALRVARFRTGGEGVVITANAYHGVTTAAAEISPSLGPAVPLGRAAGTPRISAVRGAGLYLAADFVHPDTGEPDGDTALRVVNGLRERRVLISATGPHGHTLKIRPPLPFSRADADRLAESLTDTLRTL